MTYIFMTLMFCAGSFAQNLSPDEQKKLLTDMQEMKARLERLENKSPASGLKTVNYQNETAGPATSTQPAGTQGSLSPEQTKKLLDEIAALKEKQLESQKILEQLDKEEP